MSDSSDSIENIENIKQTKRCNKCELIKSTDLFDKKTFVSDIKKGRERKLRLSNICKECQKQRNKDNYIRNYSMCKKCNLKKIQITDLQTGNIKLMCKNCKPVCYMDKKQKEIHDMIIEKFKNDKEFKKMMRAYGPLLPRIFFI